MEKVGVVDFGVVVLGVVLFGVADVFGSLVLPVEDVDAVPFTFVLTSRAIFW